MKLGITRSADKVFHVNIHAAVHTFCLEAASNLEKVPTGFESAGCNKKALRPERFFCGAPGRAHLLGGGSPLLARQGEELAERQGCSGRLEIWRKPKAKRWPDEQEADRRRHGGVSRPLSAKPETCTERRDVYPTGISVKVSAQYPGRSAQVPRETSVLLASRGVGMPVQKSAEAIVAASRERRAEH